jgi:hypothetical protein
VIAPLMIYGLLIAALFAVLAIVVEWASAALATPLDLGCGNLHFATVASDRDTNGPLCVSAGLQDHRAPGRCRCSDAKGRTTGARFRRHAGAGIGRAAGGARSRHYSRIRVAGKFTLSICSLCDGLDQNP